MDDLSDRDLANSFESLGGSGHGDEFGLLQKHLGHDAQGLLRDADLDHDLLIKALESRFDGVGSVENTIIFQPGHSDEWWTKDRRYWMAMRSFVKAADTSLDDVTDQLLDRIRSLRHKLIEDLEAGEKIFVFKTNFRNLADADLFRLHTAIQGYGNSTLLYVRHADEAHPAGMVEVRQPGLLVGYIAHFSFSTNDDLLGPVNAAPVNAAWSALCRRAHDLRGNPSLRSRLPSASPAASQGHTGKTRRRIVLIGNCQIDAMAKLYRQFVAARTGDTLEVIPSYQDLTPAGQLAIEQADVVVEQLLDLRPRADTTDLGGGRPRLLVPMVTAAFLWPFAGQQHPRNTPPSFMTTGPYGGEAGDSYLNRMIAANVPAEQAVETYASLDVRTRVNLDRLYELVMDRQRSRDETTGYQIAGVIERYFRQEQTFLSPYHPNVRIAVTLAAQFFEQLGAERDDIERMRIGTRATPFPKDELPIHPGVGRHFGLSFASADQKYRFMNEGSFTFREYALRYMRYEWNDALEEGLSLLRAGRHEQARPCLDAALLRSPRSAAAHDALSHVLSQQGAHDQAFAAVRRAIELKPDFAPYHAHLGNLLRNAGHLREAEAALRSAVAADPTEPHFHILLAHLIRQLGQVDEACEVIRQAIRQEPFSARLQAQLADGLEAKGDLPGAITALQAAATLDPDTAATYHRLTQILGRLNRFQEAVDAARQAMALDLDAARFHITLSDFLLRQDRPRQALTEAYAATASGPPNARAYGHLGHVLRQAGDPAAAELAFRHAADLEPDSAHIQHEFSVLFNQQQRFADAIAAARKATQLEPRNPHRFVHLASLLMHRNDLAGAEAEQRRAVGLSPETEGFRIFLGDLVARQGRLQEALADARAVVKDHPDSAPALGHLAHLTHLTGDPGQSELLVRRAIEMKPDDKSLHRQLASPASA
ncbi:WcbI family polysaccharide biosynthesis putative acetyltransferase [Rhodopila sp.]|uniref:WcbI family polysaccharide biosynthesis putative acetyltransferase n=1 Tax=Rhodopila sp. TaxID=2480087 RepID=UPI003D09BA3D